MPRFLDENGKPTADEKAAAIDPKCRADVKEIIEMRLQAQYR
jgi:hypothetical protein